MKTKFIAVLLSTTLTFAAGCADSHERHMLFQMSSETNTVYLLGSIHMLRKQDHPLPSVMQDAYQDAEILVMELGMDDLDPTALASTFRDVASVQQGQTLESLMGEQYQEAVKLAETMDANLKVFNNFEPWFVAITIVNLEMMKIGYFEHLGLESPFFKARPSGSKRNHRTRNTRVSNFIV